MSFTSCSEDYIRDHGNGKPAVIDYVRVCDPAKADSAIYEAQMLSIIAIVGSNLQSVKTILFGETDWTVYQRYISSCMLLMTFIVTTCVLVPMGGDAKQLLFSGNGLYHHLLVPILSIASYLLIEQHVKSPSAIAVPTVITFIYGAVMLWLNYRGLFDGPYPFFRVKQQSAGSTVLWMAVLIAAIALMSALIFFLGR